MKYKHIAIESSKSETNFAARAGYNIERAVSDFMSEQGMVRGDQEVSVFVVILPTEIAETYKHAPLKLSIDK